MRKSVWEVNLSVPPKSGIAPFYSDKYAKIGFQVSELFDDGIIEGKGRTYVCRQKKCMLRAFVSQTTD